MSAKSAALVPGCLKGSKCIIPESKWVIAGVTGVAAAAAIGFGVYYYYNNAEAPPPPPRRSAPRAGNGRRRRSKSSRVRFFFCHLLNHDFNE